MTTEKFTLSKPLGLLVIALLGAAFFAGTHAKDIASAGEAYAAPRGSPEVAAASLAAVPVESMTAEQGRQLSLDIRELRAKLDETNTKVGELNGRLSRLEGKEDAKIGK